MVRRQWKRHGQEQYETVDVHGSSSGIPVWMTEAGWRDLRVAERPKVPLVVLENLRALLVSLRCVSNGQECQSTDQCYERDQTTNASAAAKRATRAGETRIATGTGAAAGGTAGAKTQT